MSILSGFLAPLIRSAEAGAIKSIESGLQYEAKVQKITIWAVKHANAAAIAESLAVSEAWIAETVTEAGEILPSVIAALSSWGPGGSPVDPWAGSRALAQKLIADYAAAAGVKP